MNPGNGEQARFVRPEQPALRQLGGDLGFAAPQRVEHRFAVFIRFGLFHGFAALDRRYRRAGQHRFALVPHAVQVHIGVQRQGKARRGHGAHSAQIRGHIHRYIHVQRAHVRRIRQLGLAGIGKNHAFRQLELHQIIAGLQGFKNKTAFFIGLNGALHFSFNGMQGNFRARQAGFLAVPFAVIIGVEPGPARQGACAHQARAHADGCLGRKGEGLGEADIVFISSQTVIKGIDLLAHRRGRIVLWVGDAQPVGARGKIPHHGLAFLIRNGGGDGVGFSLVFIQQLHRYAAHQRLALHAAAVEVHILKGDHAHQTRGFRHARVDLAALVFPQGKPGRIAHVALGGQRGAVQAVEGKVVFLGRFHPQPVFPGRQPVNLKFAGFGRRGILCHLGVSLGILHFQSHLRAGQAAFVGRHDPVGGFVHPYHAADLTPFGHRPLNA